MLAVTLAKDDILYWEMENTKPPSPMCKWLQAEEGSLDDLVSTVKMAMSTKKPPKSALKGSPLTTSKTKSQMRFASNSQTVALQVTTISQLTEMVSAVQQENKTIMTCFDQLLEPLAALISQSQVPLNQCQARGHRSESGQST